MLPISMGGSIILDSAKPLLDNLEKLDPGQNALGLLQNMSCSAFKTANAPSFLTKDATCQACKCDALGPLAGRSLAVACCCCTKVFNQHVSASQSGRPSFKQLGQQVLLRPCSSIAAHHKAECITCEWDLWCTCKASHPADALPLAHECKLRNMNVFAHSFNWTGTNGGKSPN
jgi:hypothetical protein